jgi:hypothetical protein
MDFDWFSSHLALQSLHPIHLLLIRIDLVEEPRRLKGLLDGSTTELQG